VGLVAQIIEGQGIPTLVIGTAFDIMSKVRPPRGVFVDHPVGRTFGPPMDRARNESVLLASLEELPRFTAPEQIRSLTYRWQDEDTRVWEEELRTELLHDR
jgi:D-proline reductase (dithiol) PrdB